MSRMWFSDGFIYSKLLKEVILKIRSHTYSENKILLIVDQLQANFLKLPDMDYREACRMLVEARNVSLTTTNRVGSLQKFGVRF